MLKLTNLTIQDNEQILVEHVSLNVFKGAIHAIIGPSGSGKSLTAMALVDRIPRSLTVSDYEVELDDKKINNWKDILGKRIGVITQDYSHSFNSHQKIGKQLLRIYRYHFKVSKKEARERIIHALNWVKLDSTVLRKYRFNLSGGQQQRLQIASVLMLDPEIIIADEITSSLDKVTGKKVMELIQHIAKDHGQTFLLISHDISHVESFADYITVMKDGRILEQGNIEAVKNSKDKFVKDILTKLKIKGDF